MRTKSWPEAQLVFLGMSAQSAYYYNRNEFFAADSPFAAPDCNQNGEGATLYFPVFHPGSGFVLGDRHAAMGDGELTGSALETSMDLEFTVNVITGFATPRMRAETADYLISFGVAGSVPDAIQIATAQLADWLKRDYRLNDNEVAVVLGSALRTSCVHRQARTTTWLYGGSL